MSPVSVIIPAFKAADMITRAVASVLAQHLPANEIIVVSDDGVDYATILEGAGICDPSIMYIQTGGIATGAANARNCGVEASRNAIIAMLDADDYWSPGYLQALVPLAERHHAAISQICFVDGKTLDELPNCGKAYDSGLLPLEDIYSACVHTYASIVYNKNIISKQWDRYIPLLEDAVFLAECCAVTGQVYYCAEPLYHYTHHSQSQCNQPDDTMRFILAGCLIRERITQGRVCAGNQRIRDILLAYLSRNDHIEMLVEAALKEGKAQNYQQFIRDNRELLYTPLV